jgi:hypothetical protein
MGPDWTDDVLHDLAAALASVDRRDEALRWLAAWPVGAPRGLVVAADGSWFRVGDQPKVELGRRFVLRRLLAALATAPDRGLTRAALLEAGWPGERILPNAARNRLNVALFKLRALGLDALVEATRDGYRLSPAVRVTRA